MRWFKSLRQSVKTAKQGSQDLARLRATWTQPPSRRELSGEDGRLVTLARNTAWSRLMRGGGDEYFRAGILADTTEPSWSRLVEAIRDPLMGVQGASLTLSVGLLRAAVASAVLAGMMQELGSRFGRDHAGLRIAVQDLRTLDRPDLINPWVAEFHEWGNHFDIRMHQTADDIGYGDMGTIDDESREKTKEKKTLSLGIRDLQDAVRIAISTGIRMQRQS